MKPLIAGVTDSTAVGTAVPFHATRCDPEVFADDFSSVRLQRQAVFLLTLTGVETGDWADMI